MVRVLGVHRADHADLVNACGKLREQFREFDSALAFGTGGKRRWHDLTALRSPGCNTRRRILARIPMQGWLGVKRVHMRRAPVHEQEDDPLRPCGKVRWPGS